MKRKPIDRRIQKTRKLLSEALISLIVEKGYEAVTVQDIIDRANVGRSTFYSHFENKEQLLFAGHVTFQQILEEAGKSQEKNLSGLPINLLALFEHIEQNRQLAKAMIGKNSGDIVARHLRDIMALKISGYLKQKKRTEPGMRNFIAEAAAAAIISLIENWLEDHKTISPLEMAAKAQDLLLKIID